MKTPYYLFYADDFILNYIDLEKAFTNIYPFYRVAYSFKTNYTPAVCKLVFELGGYAEVVSDMEYEIARRIGFPTTKIIYNGPQKGVYLEESILKGGILNIDNFREINIICKLGAIHKGLTVGLRVNFDIGNGLHSRFGIDAYSGDLEKAIKLLNEHNVRISGVHFHISRARGIEAWKKRIDKILLIADKIEEIQGKLIEYIDIGSGMFGVLPEELKNQFDNVPTYQEYAQVVAGAMAKHYNGRKKKPCLFTEPGTTLVSKYFSLYATVLDIKEIRNKSFALLDCSVHNAGEICSLKKVPLSVIKNAGEENYYKSIDLVGYTCLEQDVIYHNFDGSIGVNDIIEFKNVGGYSIVDKPPFIYPDIPVYMLKENKLFCVKRAQTVDDIFAPYFFKEVGINETDYSST